MPTASGAPLGNRLASIANKHKKVNLQTSLKSMLNNARARGEIRSGNVTPVYQNYFSPKPENKTVTCGKKPIAWMGTQKNPAFEEWKKCTGVAAGGKRKTRKAQKTRKAKKAKRATRRR
jgi:hypothetical protein